MSRRYQLRPTVTEGAQRICSHMEHAQHQQVGPWPTLGPQVRQLLAERAIHGPGDLRGQAASIDDEKAALVDRRYQVYPRWHPRAGRRRFKRCAISVRNGSAKTELAASVMFADLHPEGPVRTDGWHKVDEVWQPVGRPVTDPFIPMVAYTEEQTEEPAYGALLCICSEGRDADLFDAGKERITRAYGDGNAEALASSPNSADGARTAYQHFDETHRMVLPRLKGRPADDAEQPAQAGDRRCVEAGNHHDVRRG